MKRVVIELYGLDLCLREFLPDDEDEVLELFHRCEEWFVRTTGGPTGPGDVQSLFYALPNGVDIDAKTILTVWLEQTCVGLVDAVRMSNEWVAIGMFIVDPRIREKGVGTEVGRTLLDSAAADGVRRVTATSHHLDVSGEALLLRLGFQAYGSLSSPSFTSGPETFRRWQWTRPSQAE